MIRVLAADDQTLVRAGFRVLAAIRVVAAGGVTAEQVGQAASAGGCPRAPPRR